MAIGGKNYNNTGLWAKGAKRDGLEQWLAGDGYEQTMNGNFNAQTNIDVRVLATVDLFLREKGYKARGTSELLKLCVRLLFEQAIKENIEPFMQIQDGIDYLETYGYRLSQLQSYKKGRMARAQTAEELRIEKNRSTVIQGMDFGKIDSSIASLSPESRQIRREILSSMDSWTQERFELHLKRGLSEADAAYEAKFDKRELDAGKFDSTCELPPVSGDNINAQTAAQQARANEEAQAMKDYMAKMISEAKRRGQVIDEPSE